MHTRRATKKSALPCLEPASLDVSASAAQLASRVCAHVAAVAAESIRLRGRFLLALSGGSLPKALAPLAQDASIQWERWVVVFVDERHVPLQHADSNYGVVRSALLDAVPLPAANVHPIDPSLPLDACADAYEALLRSITASEGAEGRLDLVLLGMGEDGHTASLFPGHALLAERTRWVAPIRDSPKPPPSRITMTLACIESARHIAFVAGGDGKAEPLAWIFREGRAGVPSGLVCAARPDTRWFVDQAACAKF